MNKRKFGCRRPLNIKTVFFIHFFFVLAVTRIVLSVLYSLSLDLQIIADNDLIIVKHLLPVLGIIAGTVFSRLVVRGPLNMIIDFSNATKEVTNGNFNVRLDDDTPIVEINEMTNNFNVMTEQLANTEMFRNDFISNVSHEFKTPLAAIEGYVTLLQNKNLSEEKRQVYIDKILYNTKRLSNLTGNILTLANVENEDIYIKKEEYSLDEQIRQSILLFERQWEEKNLNLDIDLDSVNYYGNSEMMMQVWQNLIGNAVKFVEYSGSIEISLRESEKGIIVSVCDDGIGMDEETRDRIFEKFYQGDTSHASDGNGLGLNIVKRVIDLHGGSISVDSEICKGTKFIVKLPN